LGKIKEPYSETSNSWHVCRILPPMQYLSENAVGQLKAGNDQFLAVLEKESADQTTTFQLATRKKKRQRTQVTALIHDQ
jgi:hypothetical protein